MLKFDGKNFASILVTCTFNRFERLSIDKKIDFNIQKNNIFLQVRTFYSFTAILTKRFKFNVGDFKVAENFYKRNFITNLSDLKQKDQSKIIGIFKKILKNSTVNNEI